MNATLLMVGSSFPYSEFLPKEGGVAPPRKHSLNRITPPYSPELNPVEHLWDELREKYFPNRIFSSLDALQEHLCTGLNALAADPDHLRSLTYFPHIRVACENAS